MKIKSGGICVFFILFSLRIVSAASAPKQFTDVPVLLQIPFDNQSDTFGFNLVHQLPEICYSLILQGKVSLWDSPKKQINISADGLKALEKGSATSFLKTKFLFLNELWTTDAKKSSYYIVGFSFMNVSKSGNVDYGFIDFEDIKPHLVKEKIKSNANGSYGVNVLEAIYSRRYFFRLLQFGSSNFKDKEEESQTIINVMFHPSKKQLNVYQLPERKWISYAIQRTSNDHVVNGASIYRFFEQIMSSNRDILFDYGGDRYFTHRFNSELVVSRIEVEEVWIKNRGQIVYYPVHVIVYVNNKKLDPIKISDLTTLGFWFHLKGMEDILKEKEFDFELSKINHTYIAGEESIFYKTALFQTAWSQLSRFVKYSLEN
jgi:hypothetical protein